MASAEFLRGPVSPFTYSRGVNPEIWRAALSMSEEPAGRRKKISFWAPLSVTSSEYFCNPKILVVHVHCTYKFVHNMSKTHIYYIFGITFSRIYIYTKGSYFLE